MGQTSFASSGLSRVVGFAGVLRRTMAGSPLSAFVVGATFSIAVVGGGIVFAASGGNELAAAELHLEGADQVGLDAFVDLLRAPVPSIPVELSVLGPTDRAIPGDTVGLYGGTLKDNTCDRQLLVAFLADNPGQAAAWAAVQGIAVSDISGLVAELTPLILRVDTAVTNHGYLDGRATPRQSVLQSGTAVLVDSRGVPRVRCACGNPLLTPTPQDRPTLIGTPWAGFNLAKVSSIVAAEAPLSAFIVLDVTTGKAFRRPVGTDGGEDSPVSDNLPKTIRRSATTTTTTAAPTTTTTTKPAALLALPPATSPGGESTAPTTPSNRGTPSTTRPTTPSTGPLTNTPPTTTLPVTTPPATTASRTPTTASPTTTATTTRGTTTTTTTTASITVPPTTTAAPVTVPTVVKLDEGTAARKLKEAGFGVSVVRKGVPAGGNGLVVDQQPQGGTTAAAGSTVQIVVGEVLRATVPELKTSSLADAKAALDAVGLTFTEGRSAVSPNLACGRDVVVGQNPAAGTVVERGSSVRVDHQFGSCPKGR